MEAARRPQQLRQATTEHRPVQGGDIAEDVDVTGHGASLPRGKSSFIPASASRRASGISGVPPIQIGGSRALWPDRPEFDFSDI